MDHYFDSQLIPNTYISKGARLLRSAAPQEGQKPLLFLRDLDVQHQLTNLTGLVETLMMTRFLFIKLGLK